MRKVLPVSLQYRLIGYKNGVEVCRDSLVTTKKTSAFKLIADS